jgi:bifunctional DNA-binding transcriptional regulator/antitoxin component of YhaV-PrlF toxin-antitoxin module
MPAADRRVREIVKARTVAGCVVITLPLRVRESLGIIAGDRVAVEVVSAGLFVTPEDSGTRHKRKRKKGRKS